MTKRETYPHLPGGKARKKIGREALDEYQADGAFDEREIERIESQQSRPVEEAKSAESRRVAGLIARDKADEATERLRTEAVQQAESGSFENFADTVLPPTPEQLASGEFTTRIPRQPEGTVRTVKGYRRKRVTVIGGMWERGQISDEGLRACQWYADAYERAGFWGMVPSVDLQREVFSAPSQRFPFTERQLDAQSELRSVQKSMSRQNLAFFEAVVLQNVPLRQARKFARIRNNEAPKLLNSMAEAAFSAAKKIGALA